MSLRQVRKIKEAQKSSKEEPLAEEEEEEVFRTKKTVFSRAAFDSSSSSSSDDEDEAPRDRAEGTAALAGPSKRAPAKLSPVANSAPKAGKIKAKIVSDPTLRLDMHKLNPRSELRRIFGAAQQRASGSSRVVKRKHWLVEPEKDWPLVVKDVFKMELCADGSYRLVPEAIYEAKLESLSRIIVTHDIEALYHFVQINPFHPHGLIQLASILIEQRSEFENAYHLVRRALYAYQSAFLPAFHPTGSLALSSDSIFSASLLRALLLYSHLLAGQGCVRTSLEFLKLIYEMEGGMLTGCARTHALTHMDVAAYRCGEMEWLSGFVVENRLVDTLPSSSLMFAISQKMREVDSDQITTVSKKDKVSLDMPATRALVRTILTFPGVVKQVIGRDVPAVDRTASILTNKLVQAFCSKGGPAAVKADEKIIQWITDVVDRVLPGIIESTGVKSFQPDTPTWLLEGYSDITSSEFEFGKSSSGSFVEPAPLLQSEAHVLELYSEGEFVVPTRSSSTGPTLRHAVSLESNPVAAFLQMLLPWSTLDTTGTESTPITGRGLLEQLRLSLGIDRSEEFTHEPVIQDAHPNTQEEGDSEDEEEEELNID